VVWIPKVIVQAIEAGESQVTLAECIMPCQIRCEHYAVQLLERISWAVQDAEVIEARGDVPAGE
jgi:hypothetical protein